MLFLYTQGKKETVEEYGPNFKSLWDTVEAFEGSPGIHKGLMDSIFGKRQACQQLSTGQQSISQHTREGDVYPRELPNHKSGDAI